MFYAPDRSKCIECTLYERDRQRVEQGPTEHNGGSPLFLIDANVRGAGKGLLARAIGRIVLGREMPVSSYAHDPEELRKKITSIAIAGDRLILFDNLEGVFGNDALDRALTSTSWKDRILGKSEQVELPLIPAWYATGNNVQVAADAAPGGQQAPPLPAAGGRAGVLRLRHRGPRPAGVEAVQCVKQMQQAG